MDNLSFVNMNGRVYNYSGSRFLSPDPTIPDPTNTSSYNRYAYVNYNPLTYTDPSGYCIEIQDIDGNVVVPCVDPPLLPPPYLPPLSPPTLTPISPPGEGAIPHLTRAVINLMLQQNPCPSAAPLSKHNMTPVPFTDDNGNPILGPDGQPIMRPAGFDPHFYTAAGNTDAAKYGPDTFNANAILNFRQGAPWDAQRDANKNWYPDFRTYANVAIGLYFGANGKTSDQANALADVYASRNSQWTGEPMDTQFPHLPAQNVDNTDLGVTLATMGRGLGVCTPGVRR
jgi:RHS repeat-associated protein